MSEETTTRLEGILKDVKSIDDAKGFAEAHAKEKQPLHERINEYIGRHDMLVKDVIERSGISKNYIYNILNGNTKNPGRDKVIALCVALGMSQEELNRTLKISGHNSLYPKNKRDIYIAACVNKGINNVTELNLELDNQGVPPLDV